MLKTLFMAVGILCTDMAAQTRYTPDQLLMLSLDELMTVQITTATGQADKISDIPASVIVVTHQEIETYGYQNLTEILSHIPGLYVVDDYLQAHLGIRGFWTYRANRNIMILINGIPQADDIFSDYRLENLNLDVRNIDRIEVIRGPMSVIYGSGAFYGVINIKTNIHRENAVSHRVSLSGGSEGSSRLSLKSTGHEGTSGYAFNASLFNTDGPDFPYIDMVSSADRLVDFGVRPDATTRGQLKNSNTYLNFSAHLKDFYFDASYAMDDRGVLFVFPTVGLHQSELITTRLSAGYKPRLSKTISLDLSASLHDISWGFNPGWIQDNYYGWERDRARSYRLNTRIFWSMTDRLELTAGLSLHEIPHCVINWDHPGFPGFADIWFTLGENQSISNQAVYAQMEWQVASRIKLVGGGRFERTPQYRFEKREGNIQGWQVSSDIYDESGWDFIPRLAAIFTINDSHHLKLMYGKAINKPAFIQNNDMLYNKAMPMLKPELIQTLELNYLSQPASWLGIQISLFYNQLNDLIHRSLFAQGTEVWRNHANSGRASTEGFELTLQAKPAPNSGIEISGTYQRTEDIRQGSEYIAQSYSPHFLGYLKAYHQWHSRYSFALTGNYVDDMVSYFDSSLNPPGRIGQPVAGYFILGINFHISDILKEGLSVNGRLSNLLNHHYFYPVTANHNSWMDIGTPGRGRTCLISAEYTF